MSERLNVCKALGAMLRKHGDPEEQEVTFVANAALELGLTQNEIEQVMTILKEGGDYNAMLPDITSRQMRTYLFRRVVAATLLDEKIEDDELALIHSTAKAFGFNGAVVDEYLHWMKEGIEWEKRGAVLMARL